MLSRPESYAVRMNKAISLTRLRRTEDSLAEYTAAARARPEDHRPRYERAQAYQRLGKYAEAAADLTEVLKQFPESAGLYEERAACYAASGDNVKEGGRPRRRGKVAAGLRACTEQARLEAAHGPRRHARPEEGIGIES